MSKILKVKAALIKSNMIYLPSMLLAKVGSAVSWCRLKSPDSVLYPLISSFRTDT